MSFGKQKSVNKADPRVQGVQLANVARAQAMAVRRSRFMIFSPGNRQS